MWSAPHSALPPQPSALSPQPPLILYAESRRGLHVTACSPDAVRAGVRVGMPLGEARSLLPGNSAQKKSARFQQRQLPKPRFQRADAAADRTRLQQLALRFQRYSPLVGLEEAAEPESLWLDVSGNEALFGGESGLMEAVRADLAQQGFQARIAIADTWGAAWAMSHFGPPPLTIVPSARQAEVLGPLPIFALRLSGPVVDSLRSLDVSTIERLMRLPRTALPSRFGKELLRRLDQALGTIPEMLPVERSVEPLIAEWLFEDPVSDRQTLEHVMGVLLDQILGQLNERRVSLREVHCRWLGTCGDPMSLRLLRPTTDRRHLFELLRLQCERRPFTEAVSGLRMEVVEMGLPPVRQALLFEGDADKAERHQRVLAELVDRLDSRLGRQAVLRPNLRPDPQPEYACECVPWLTSQVPLSSETTSLRSHLRCRPLRLLRTPQQLNVNNQSASSPSVNGKNGPATTGASTASPPTRVNQLPVVRITGPERIETGWWRGPDAKRDYYRLDLSNGTSLWAFVDRDTGEWFWHGTYV